MASNTTYRIGWGMITALLLFSGVADLITLIPLAGTVVGPVYWIVFSVYLYIKGFGWLNSRRLATSALSLIGELIPAIQAFPLIMAGTLAVILLTRFEDRLGIPVINSKRPVSLGGKVLNQGGVRQPQMSNTPSRNQNLKPLVVDGVRAPQP